MRRIHSLRGPRRALYGQETMLSSRATACKQHAAAGIVQRYDTAPGGSGWHERCAYAHHSDATKYADGDQPGRRACRGQSARIACMNKTRRALAHARPAGFAEPGIDSTQTQLSYFTIATGDDSTGPAIDSAAVWFKCACVCGTTAAAPHYVTARGSRPRHSRTQHTLPATPRRAACRTTMRRGGGAGRTQRRAPSSATASGWG